MRFYLPILAAILFVCCRVGSLVLPEESLFVQSAVPPEMLHQLYPSPTTAPADAYADEPDLAAHADFDPAADRAAESAAAAELTCNFSPPID